MPTYFLSNKLVTFAPLPHPSSKKPPLLDYSFEAGARLGAAKNEGRGLSSSSIANLLSLYGKNTFYIPTRPSERYLQNMTLHPSLFSRFSVSRCGVSMNTGTTACSHLFMLFMFGCIVVWRRVLTLSELRSMSIEPYPIQCYCDGKWVKVQTDEPLPRDVASLGVWLYSLKGFLCSYIHHSPPSASEL